MSRGRPTVQTAYSEYGSEYDESDGGAKTSLLYSNGTSRMTRRGSRQTPITSRTFMNAPWYISVLGAICFVVIGSVLLAQEDSASTATTRSRNGKFFAIVMLFAPDLREHTLSPIVPAGTPFVGNSTASYKYTLVTEHDVRVLRFAITFGIFMIVLCVYLFAVLAGALCIGSDSSRKRGAGWWPDAGYSTAVAVYLDVPGVIIATFATVVMFLFSGSRLISEIIAYGALVACAFVLRGFAHMNAFMSSEKKTSMSKARIGDEAQDNKPDTADLKYVPSKEMQSSCQFLGFLLILIAVLHASMYEYDRCHDGECYAFVRAISIGTMMWLLLTQAFALCYASFGQSDAFYYLSNESFESSRTSASKTRTATNALVRVRNGSYATIQTFFMHAWVVAVAITFTVGYFSI